MLGRVFFRWVSYTKSGIVPIRFSSLYETVAETQHYSQFIPWCSSSSIIKRMPNDQNITRLTILFGKLEALSYDSHVTLTKQSNSRGQQTAKIISICQQSPLKRLESHWEITQKATNMSEVNYSLEYTFESLLHQLTSKVLLHFMGDSLWNIFIQRAKLKSADTFMKSKEDNVLRKPQTSVNDSIQSEKLAQNSATDLAGYFSKNPIIASKCQQNHELLLEVQKKSKQLEGYSHYQAKMDHAIANLLVYFSQHS